MKVTAVLPEEYSPYYSAYMDKVSTEYDLVEELEISVHRLVKFIREIPGDKFDYRYAEGKWTVKDILQHLIDAERVFSYRALRFARSDEAELEAFEEDDYAVEANANSRSIQELLSEILAVRQSTITLFKSFKEEQLLRQGIAAEKLISVRALGFIIIGHQNHHMGIIAERYLS
ncbi:MAG: DinB family protein [Flavobacterium sp.]